MLLLDGGTVATAWVQFAGYTSAAFTGNLGGRVGANQKCAADFPGAFFCTASDYSRGEPVVAPPASGAWVDYDRDANGDRSPGACFLSGANAGSWMEGTNVDYAAVVNPTGNVYNGVTCDNPKPLACCRGASRSVFRGYTNATFTGNLGGHVGANQKCHAEYPGSRFCTTGDFSLGEPHVGPPASGAWVDYNRDASGSRSAGACFVSGANAGSWTEDTNVDYAAVVNPAGNIYNGVNCNNPKPLACCEAR